MGKNWNLTFPLVKPAVSILWKSSLSLFIQMFHDLWLIHFCVTNSVLGCGVDHTMSFWHLIPLLASPGAWVEIWTPCCSLHDLVSSASPFLFSKCPRHTGSFQFLGDWKTVAFFSGSGHLHMLFHFTGMDFSTIHLADVFRPQLKWLLLREMVPYQSV